MLPESLLLVVWMMVCETSIIWNAPFVDGFMGVIFDSFKVPECSFSGRFSGSDYL